jgi:hypothetical protein
MTAAPPCLLLAERPSEPEAVKLHSSGMNCACGCALFGSACALPCSACALSGCLPWWLPRHPLLLLLLLLFVCRPDRLVHDDGAR